VIYFVGVSFNDAQCSSDYIASDDRQFVNKELEVIWNEAVVAYVKALARNLFGGTE
jgi:hypothetical protein